MANVFYTPYKNALLTDAAGVDWTSDTIKAVLCSTGYTANLVTDDFFNDVPGGAQLAPGEVVSTITVAGGAILISGTVTFASVGGPDDGTHVVIYKDTGSAATSRLLAHLDDSTVGLPVTPDGDDIVLQFDVAGMFQL